MQRGFPVLPVACGIAGCLVGAVASWAIFGNAPAQAPATDPGSAVASVGTDSIAKDALAGTPYVSYTVGGEVRSLTVSDAIEKTSSLSVMEKDDGTYSVPSVESVLDYIRNELILEECSNRGISPTQDDINAYMLEYVGTTDVSSISAQSGLPEDELNDQIEENCKVQLLYKQVVGDKYVAAPERAPEKPEDLAGEPANAECGRYVCKMLGDEWDAANDTWARRDGDYYAALGDGAEDIHSDSATYSQASAVYAVAYQRYQAANYEANTLWNEFLTGLFAKSSMSIGSVVASDAS
jgi:hypothetical protein